MKYIHHTALLLFCIFLYIFPAHATHNRAGEITYKQISALTYEFTLITFTDISNGNNVDRPSAVLNFGDGTSNEQPRIKKDTLKPDAPFIQRNKYVFIHTFPGYATYTISYQDPNRNNNVNNMINSINTPFYIETQLVINPFIGFNNSPTLLLEPVDFGGLNKLFVHNPNAYDEDGDSLSFKLIPCKQDVGLEVYGYQFPTPQNGYASVRFDIDEKTGQVVWENPTRLGLYNIAIMIEEWRYVQSSGHYEKIGYIVRDMQIEIVNTDNIPPVINPINDICVLAGTTLSQTISATDANNHVIKLTATGGPFNFSAPNNPIFPQPTSGTGNVSQVFNWTPSCNAVRKEPYQIVFKVTDNGNPKLVDLEDWQITVVAPPPTNLNANATGNAIQLTWNNTVCLQAKGYKIYRRSGSYNFNPSGCETGIPANTGYILIKTIDDITINSYLDNDDGKGLSPGNNYCYRIIAYYNDGAESYASNESCDKLSRDVPSITHVTIVNTNTSTGSDSVRWSKPTELDTIQYPGPYSYTLYRISSVDPNPVLVATYNSNTFAGLVDSAYSDVNLNTKEQQFKYQIGFSANAILVGNSRSASSLFLHTNPLDNKIELTWDVDVPWVNDSVEIYRLNSVTSIFEKIGSSITSSFIDTGLTNGSEYCYFARSFGKYSAGGFPEPLINNSQKACEKPIDNQKPCTPILSVTPGCQTYQNELSWTLPSDSCLEDIVGYKIYKSLFEGGEFFLLSEINSRNTFNYSDINLQYSIAGCYAITAIDSFNNESITGNIICVDNCPQYALPNAFTPNGDGINDLFTPIKDSIDFVDQVKVQIFGRWGNIVYESTNPMIMWDGRDQNSKEELPAGVYYYTVEFSEIRIKGLKPKSLTGFVHLLR